MNTATLEFNPVFNSIQSGRKWKEKAKEIIDGLKYSYDSLIWHREEKYRQ